MLHDAAGREAVLPHAMQRFFDPVDDSRNRGFGFVFAFVFCLGLAALFAWASIHNQIPKSWLLIGAGGLTLALLLRTAVKRRRRRQVGGWDRKRTKQLRRVLATTEATPIRATKPGRCRIRGTLHVLRSVGGDPSAGAIYRRVRHTDRRLVEVYDPETHQHTREERTATSVSDSAECGRFAVVDDTGIAIVDDDAFEIWSFGGTLPPNDDGVLMASEGQVVEIIGPAAQAEAREATELGPKLPGDYRSGSSSVALVFDGTPKDPVWIVVERLPQQETKNSAQ